MNKKTVTASLGLLMAFTLNTQAENLVQTYQLALKNDASYQQALATYNAAKEAIPLARAAFLPSVLVTGAISRPIKSVPKAPPPKTTLSQAYTLTLKQSLFDLGSWEGYSAAFITVQQAAITLQKAKQTLINTVANNYFAVLQAEDSVNYFQSNENALEKTLTQSEQKYKVGLSAKKDVDAAKANYQSARASTIGAKNTVDNAKETLRQSTGQYINSLAPLKDNITWSTPKPANPDVWAKQASEQNLDVLIAKRQAELDQRNISIAQAGSVSTPGYLPTVTAQGTYSRNFTSTAQTTSDRSTTTAAANINWTPFSGGSTYYSVKQKRLTHQATLAGLDNAIRVAKSTARQAYGGVLSDISQIDANKQAVVSAESARASLFAQYQVGLTTIVDYLTQQALLVQAQQNYSAARYQYFKDKLTLDAQAGQLSLKSLEAINKWLVQK